MVESQTVEDTAMRKTIEPSVIIAVALSALVIFVAIVVWQTAYHFGSLQSTDLLLASPDATAEVIQLRAQLQEARSYQTTLLSVVLASFAAGFTVLVVVNFAVLFIAQRNYDREEKRMREFLILEAEKRDTALASRSRTELRELRNTLDQRIVQATEPLEKGQAETRGLLGRLLEGALSQSKTINLLSKRLDDESTSRKRQMWEMLAVDAERINDYSKAVRYRSLILQSEMENPGGSASWSNIRQILRIVDNLENIEEPTNVPGTDLTTVLEALTVAQTLENLDEPTANDIAHGIGLLEALRERQSPSWPYAIEPPPNILRMPPTKPLRVPTSEPPMASDE